MQVRNPKFLILLMKNFARGNNQNLQVLEQAIQQIDDTLKCKDHLIQNLVEQNERLTNKNRDQKQQIDCL